MSSSWCRTLPIWAEGEGDDLAGHRRVGEDLLIAVSAVLKQTSPRPSGGADAAALDHRAVGSTSSAVGVSAVLGRGHAALHQGGGARCGFLDDTCAAERGSRDAAAVFV